MEEAHENEGEEINNNVIHGRTIQLFLKDGTPTGLTVATLHGWTGIILVARNATLPSLLARSEAKRTGLYVLYGTDPANDLGNSAYIGEADAISERLPKSAKDYGFWEIAAVITTSDESLTKGHVRYLEARMIEMVQAAEWVSLYNTQKPDSKNRHLPEADRANMEAFLANIRLMLPVVGLNLFRSRPHSQVKMEIGNLREFTIRNNSGVDATMIEVEDEYIVRAGSTALKDTPTQNISYSRLKQVLIDKGRLIDDGDFYRFVEDTGFSSPSAAAAVVLDRNANGRTEWKYQGKTYADCQSETTNEPG